MKSSFTWKWIPAIVLLSISVAAGAQTQPAQVSTSSATTHHGDPDIQQKRQDFLKNAVALGLISKIEDAGPVTRVLVEKKFMSMSFADREDILNVIWAYYKTQDPQKDVVQVVDQKTGKKLGEYSPASGGLRMK